MQTLKKWARLLSFMTFEENMQSQVNITDVSDNDVLAYDLSSKLWKNENMSLANLTDTTITSPTTDDLLQWNGTAWVPVGVQDIFPEPVAWSSWSATPKGSSPTTTNTLEFARYIVYGKKVNYNFRFTFTTTAGTVNYFEIPVPDGTVNVDNCWGGAHGRDAGSGSTAGTPMYIRAETTGDLLIVGKADASNFANATNNYVNCWGWYIKD
jgi:hypothetical protein